MDLRRLRVGEGLLALAGTALIVSLFLHWYERGGAGLSGWSALSAIDWILALVGAIALTAVVVTATQPTTAVSISLESLTVLFGLLATILALTRVIDQPGLPPGYSVAVGAYIGLAAAIGVMVAALVAIRDERIDPGTDATGRPVAAQPEVELVTPPRPETG
jgi:energy-coupling factor transporter transmembrane protein EcfT